MKNGIGPRPHRDFVLELQSFNLGQTIRVACLPCPRPGRERRIDEAPNDPSRSDQDMQGCRPSASWTRAQMLPNRGRSTPCNEMPRDGECAIVSNADPPSNATHTSAAQGSEPSSLSTLTEAGITTALKPLHEIALRSIPLQVISRSDFHAGS
jgi:hypothetical protein